MTPLAHIFGIPVEETLSSFGPALAIGIGAVTCAARAKARRLRNRPRRSNAARRAR
jgi:hypothetical protein